ncbi:GGDEF domain-containing protein [Syntrophomonas palmitatica]|uniref:GGDEF domain-containing protein n=1 Tax=Syntrophomonas palmitatica TaxID=402877 RepID=UPI0006D27FC0|nr:GGDEF domain-containing protein [Syntrophomonas palmitatica]
MSLRNMGCDYGQGYLLARPGKIINEIEESIKTQIVSYSNYHLSNCSHSKTVGAISVYENPGDISMKVKEVVSIFNSNQNINGIVICEDRIPAGLIMRDRLFAMLGTRYGYDVFIKRPVKYIMDSKPLVLPWDYPIEAAAQRVAKRIDKGITDYIVVTLDNLYYGVVSVAKLLDSMAKIQVEQARDSNPLTGLPGNRSITERIIGELDQADRVMTVLYLDLDNFKAFNDRYGFEHGDKAILMVAEIMRKIVSMYGNKDDLIGHIGGDDFAIITTPDKADSIAEMIIKEFDCRVVTLYDNEDRDKGFISTIDRQGQLFSYPVMSISIAAVSNETMLSKTTCN